MSLTRQKSAQERAGAAAALAVLAAEADTHSALEQELHETLFEIVQIQGIPESGGSSNQSKKKKKKKKRRQSAKAPAASHGGDSLSRQLSSALLVQTRSQIAQLTRELSGAAGGGRTDGAASEDSIIDSQLAALGKEVYQIRYTQTSLRDAPYTGDRPDQLDAPPTNCVSVKEFQYPHSFLQYIRYTYRYSAYLTARGVGSGPMETAFSPPCPTSCDLWGQQGRSEYPKEVCKPLTSVGLLFVRDSAVSRV
jgi:hypothetical protein